MEVSADGFIMCANGYQDCPSYAKHGDRKIIIEIKSPYPSEDLPENVYYKVPPRPVPQLLAEMEAYNLSELWLVCCIKWSCTFISIQFDEDLWNSIWNTVTELYADEKPKMPTKIHPSISDYACVSLHLPDQTMSLCVKYLRSLVNVVMYTLIQTSALPIHQIPNVKFLK